MKPDIQSVSLYTLNASRPTASGIARTSSVASLLAVSHSIEETVMRHGMDSIFFAGFQRFSAFLPQAERFRLLAARCKKVYIFGEPDSATPAIPNLEYVPLQPGSPLTQEWFIVFAHPRFSIALLTREIGSSAASIRESRFGRGRLYQGLVTLEDHIVQPAVQLLHQALDLPEPPFIPAPLEPIQPVNTYLNQFAGYMDRAQSQMSALYNNLTERTATLERMEEIVRTMVSRRAWDDSLSMLESPQETAFQPGRRKLTILFTDIHNFTPLFEREDALELTKTLNRYFNLLATVIYEQGGDIDKFLGDGLMAFFTSPQDAVNTAAEMQRRLARFNNQQVAHRGLQLNTRIGIASGECMVTRIGSASRREITIIGDAVNMASRLQTLAPVNGLGMDETTYRAIKSPIRCLGRDVQVKGKGYQRMYSAEFDALEEFEIKKSQAFDNPGQESSDSGKEK
jgi:class 3 adenylate cyclase/DICT domain-containing protein